MKKKILALLLAALMVVSLVPMTVFAATVTFDTEYSMKNAAGEPNAIKWKLTKQKSSEFTLEIYGTGAIPKMMPSSYPWYSTASTTNTDSRLKHLIIGEGITNLPDFYGESSSTSKFAVLTDIVINSKHFDADLENAMRGHERITTVTFSEGVESIAFTAANTFASCTGIATLNLPASLKSFNYHSQTFADDTAFKTITLGEGNENFSLVDNVLYNKDKTELILAPTGLTVTPVSTVQRIAAGQNNSHPQSR